MWKFYSASEHAVETNDIYKKIEQCRISGPFLHRVIQYLRVSPINVVPKTDGGWRIITHLSRPIGNTVNDKLSQVCALKVTVPFDTVVQVIADLGPDDLIGKFRLLPVFPEDFDILGLNFKALHE